MNIENSSNREPFNKAKTTDLDYCDGQKNDAAYHSKVKESKNNTQAIQPTASIIFVQVRVVIENRREEDIVSTPSEINVNARLIC